MIVVTGATGNVGRALVERLAGAGRAVRAVSRSPERAALPAGVEVVRSDPDGLFDGASKLFLHLQGATGEQLPDLLERAARAGVRHVVLLSSGIVGAADEDETHPIHAWHAQAEQAVRDSGLAWTFLRPNAFAANAFQWAEQIRAGDSVRAPFAGALAAPVHEDDIAAVAERALLDEGHEGAVHRLTGPSATTNAAQVEAIGRAVGRELAFVEISVDEAAETMFPGMPRDSVRAILKSTAEKGFSPPEVTTTVERVTGRPARTFAAWAEDHREDFGGVKV
ncbi:NAD(P)H-binding protein [Streptomyces cavernicola]|uniref:NAD(P)H-binding protein n=1 Tax=Streptomyces cavernicola TaxID=3043613 RepID=A0ABT6SE90_9ACTN|nr:NAD(P)H-binding protein [Streptomyces sp. B-S-A6]MDI3406159.1 NAD(P)H-binding protein [Streptomyces sp. B-S-A6]